MLAAAAEDQKAILAASNAAKEQCLDAVNRTSNCVDGFTPASVNAGTNKAEQRTYGRMQAAGAATRVLQFDTDFMGELPGPPPGVPGTQRRSTMWGYGESRLDDDERVREMHSVGEAQSVREDDARSEAQSARGDDARSEASTNESVRGMRQSMHEADARSEASTAESVLTVREDMRAKQLVHLKSILQSIAHAVEQTSLNPYDKSPLNTMQCTLMKNIIYETSVDTAECMALLGCSKQELHGILDRKYQIESRHIQPVENFLAGAMDVSCALAVDHVLDFQSRDVISVGKIQPPSTKDIAGQLRFVEKVVMRFGLLCYLLNRVLQNSVLNLGENAAGECSRAILGRQRRGLMYTDLANLVTVMRQVKCDPQLQAKWQAIMHEVEEALSPQREQFKRDPLHILHVWEKVVRAAKAHGEMHTERMLYDQRDKLRQQLNLLHQDLGAAITKIIGLWGPLRTSERRDNSSAEYTSRCIRMVYDSAYKYHHNNHSYWKVLEDNGYTVPAMEVNFLDVHGSPIVGCFDRLLDILEAHVRSRKQADGEVQQRIQQMKKDDVSVTAAKATTTVVKDEDKGTARKAEKAARAAAASSPASSTTTPTASAKEVPAGASAASDTGVRCHKCKERGHVASACKNRSKCNKCLVAGHLAADCKTERVCKSCKDAGRTFTHYPKMCYHQHPCPCGRPKHVRENCTFDGKPKQPATDTTKDKKATNATATANAAAASAAKGGEPASVAMKCQFCNGNDHESKTGSDCPAVCDGATFDPSSIHAAVAWWRANGMPEGPSSTAPTTSTSSAVTNTQRARANMATTLFVKGTGGAHGLPYVVTALMLLVYPQSSDAAMPLKPGCAKQCLPARMFEESFALYFVLLLSLCLGLVHVWKMLRRMVWPTWKDVCARSRSVRMFMRKGLGGTHGLVVLGLLVVACPVQVTGFSAPCGLLRSTVGGFARDTGSMAHAFTQTKKLREVFRLPSQKSISLEVVDQTGGVQRHPQKQSPWRARYTVQGSKRFVQELSAGQKACMFSAADQIVRGVKRVETDVLMFLFDPQWLRVFASPREVLLWLYDAHTNPVRAWETVTQVAADTVQTRVGGAVTDAVAASHETVQAIDAYLDLRMQSLLGLGRFCAQGGIVRGTAGMMRGAARGIMTYIRLRALLHEELKRHEVDTVRCGEVVVNISWCADHVYEPRSMTLTRDRLVEEGHYEDLGLQAQLASPRDRVMNEPFLTRAQTLQQRPYEALGSNEITIHFGLSNWAGDGVILEDEKSDGGANSERVFPCPMSATLDDDSYGGAASDDEVYDGWCARDERVIACPTSATLEDPYGSAAMPENPNAFAVLTNAEIIYAFKDVSMKHEDPGIDSLVDDAFVDEQGNPLPNCAYGETDESCPTCLISVCDKQGNEGERFARRTQDEEVWFEAEIPVQAHSAVFNSKGSVLYMADSGCDTHLCKEAAGIRNFRSCGGHVQTADAGGMMSIDGCGDLTIEAKTDSGSAALKLEGVLVVPELHQNLLSVSRLRDAGYNVLFTDAFCGIVKGILVVPFTRINRLYYVEVKVRETSQLKTVRVDVKEVPAGNAMQARVVAHQRFGHLDVSQTGRYVDAFRDGKVNVQGPPTRCECCTLAKATLRPSRELAVEKPTECGQRVSVDTAGPFSIQSMGIGAKYFTCFKDEYSGYIVVFVHRTRAGRVAMFQKYLNLCGRYGYTVKCFRMDQAREFVCKPFVEWLQHRGVRVEYSAPHHPSSNGAAERTVRTCKEGMRTALIDSKVPLSWWSYALVDFVAKYNCFPSREFRDANNKLTIKSPYEIFHKHKPEQKFLQRFGCQALMSIGRERASDSALGARANRGIHLGTASPFGVKGGLVYCPETRKVFTGTTLEYDHDNMPFAARDVARRAAALDELVNEEGIEPDEDVDLEFVRRFCETAQSSALDTYTENDSPFVDTYAGPAVTVTDVGDVPVGYEDGEELDLMMDEIEKTMPYNIASGGDSESMEMTQKDIDAINDIRDEVRRSSRRTQQVNRFKPGREAAAAATLVVPSAYANLAKTEAEEKCMCASCRIIAREKSKAKVLESEEWARAYQAGVSLAPKEIGRVRKVPYSQAMKNKDTRFLWEPVIASEVAQFLQDNRVEYVPRPKDHTVLKSFFVLTEKYDTSNKLQKLKSRLVVDGSKQVYGQDCGHTYSPTVPAQFRNMLLSIAAANEGYFVELDDIKGAFLASALKPENDDVKNHYDVYMEIPPGYKDPEHPDYVWKANAAVYGAKGSPRAFNMKLTAVFMKQGYKNVLNDNTLFVKRIVVNGMERVHICCCFVDDIMSVSNSVELITEMRDFLLEEGLEISQTQSSRETTHLEYTGIDMDYDKDTKSWCMSQRGLIDEIVDRVQRSNPEKRLLPKRTPFPSDAVLDMGECPDEPDESKVKFFRWLVGSCLYLCQSRPDVTFCVAELSRVVRSPSERHLELAWHLVGYLMNTRSAALRFGKPPKGEELNKLNSYSDASFADCVHTRRSQSGIVVTLNGTPIYWRSKRASLVALSSTEAEYVALAALCKEVKWLTLALEELGFPQLTPCGVRVNVDNTAAIKIAEGAQSRERSKHFSLRWHYCREMQHAGYIELKYVNTKLNPADLLTKALPIQTHVAHASTLLRNPLTYDTDAKRVRAEAAVEAVAAART